jgi:hypothetical protein
MAFSKEVLLSFSLSLLLFSWKADGSCSGQFFPLVAAVKA